METKRRLDGRWEFVGAQKNSYGEWIESESFVAGLVWEFQLQFISENKTIGVIAERGDCGESDVASLSYIQNHKESTLKIEIHDDESRNLEIDPQFDIYSVEFSNDNEQIILTILNEPGFLSPPVRYTLQRME